MDGTNRLHGTPRSEDCRTTTGRCDPSHTTLAQQRPSNNWFSSQVDSLGYRSTWSSVNNTQGHNCPRAWGRPTHFEQLKNDEKQKNFAPKMKKDNIFRDTWTACYVSWSLQHNDAMYTTVRTRFLREDGTNASTQFVVPGPKGTCFDVIIFFHEPLSDRPTLDFACAEVKNHFSKVKGSGKINLMSITEQEDFHKGQYGFRVTLKVLRTKDDAVFFAGPCTGGSPWNRLNSARGEETSKKIENKKKTFWKLFSAFEEVLFQHQLCGALMELPSGCSYWKDPRLISFMDGTPCRRFHIHGCMYGVVEQHGGGQGDQETLVICFVEQGKPERTGNETRWFPRPCSLCRSRNERH